MSTFARPLFPSLLPRGVRPRGLVLAVACAAALLLALALTAPPAHALVTSVGETTVGLQPRNAANVFDGTVKSPPFGENPGAETFANAAGHAVVHGSNAYLIYWDPNNRYHGDWREVVDRFMHNAGAQSNSLSSVFAVAGQYTDKSNAPAYNRLTYRGSATDSNPYPAGACTDPHPLLANPPYKTGPIACLTDAQVRAELQAYVAAHALPTGMNTIFYMLTPPGVTVCVDAGGAGGHCSDFQATGAEESSENYETASYQHSFCSYHGDINPNNAENGDASTLLYAVIPWTAGGFGDGQLASRDRKLAYHCQDGAFDPSKEEQAEGPKATQQEPSMATCPTADGFCDRGLADLIVNQVAVEQQNTVTDPLLNAWKDAGGNEATDECRNFFAPTLGGSSAKSPETGVGSLFNQSYGNNYYLNSAFNLAALKLTFPGVPCVLGVNLVPSFTAPNTVNSGDVVGFDGMESVITLNASTTYAANGTPQPNYATYTWNFGDGSPLVSGYAPGAPSCVPPWLSPCAASVFHSYTYGGGYNVTLTVTDVGGNTASVVNPVTVIGPAPPSPPPSASLGGGAGGASASGAGGAGGSSSAGVTPAVPSPVATDAVVSRSLRGVMKNGVVVRYSVNEQVAGHLEVLLSRVLARRLGIIAPAALGLPPGSAAQVVVGKAIIVTTAGGHSTVVIQLSKRTAKRLGHLRKVTLMLRLVVRNAAAHGPLTTTVLSEFTLTH